MLVLLCGVCFHRILLKVSSKELGNPLAVTVSSRQCTICILQQRTTLLAFLTEVLLDQLCFGQCEPCGFRSRASLHSWKHRFTFAAGTRCRVLQQPSAAEQVKSWKSRAHTALLLLKDRWTDLPGSCFAVCAPQYYSTYLTCGAHR